MLAVSAALQLFSFAKPEPHSRASSGVPRSRSAVFNQGGHLLSGFTSHSCSGLDSSPRRSSPIPLIKRAESTCVTLNPPDERFEASRIATLRTSALACSGGRTYEPASCPSVL